MTDVQVPRRRPEIDPRIAQRWIDARRQEGRRRLRLCIVLGTLVVVAAAAVGLLFSPAFAVRHVRATVVEPVGEGAVASSGRAAPQAGQVPALAGLVGNHHLMIDVDANSLARRLDADPWLGAAHVARRWPATVTISVTARAPVAAVALGPSGAPTGYAEVDATGRVLVDVSSPPLGLTSLTWSGRTGGPGSWLAGTAGPSVAPSAPAASIEPMAADAGQGPTGAAAALAVLDAIPASSRPEVISADARHGLTLVVAPASMDGGSVAFVLGDGSQLQAKVTALLTLVDKADLTGISSVDLTVPSRPTATTTAGGS